MTAKKVTELTENTTVATTDLLYVVDDPAGTPLSQKATVANVVAAATPKAHTHGATAKRQVIFSVEGELATATGALRMPNQLGVTLTITGVYLNITTAPTGAAVIVDVNIDGTTCFTNQANRPQIAIGANSGNSTTVENATWADGHYITFDVDQIGATVKGSNLTVTVVATE